jgi:hypothetical protein
MHGSMPNRCKALKVPLVLRAGGESRGFRAKTAETDFRDETL